MVIGDDDAGLWGGPDPRAGDESLPQPSGQGRIPIVGIGASAGGLDALRTLFTAMPSDTGIGFLVVQHLDAEHHSLLAELLSKYTAMPVAQVENGMRAEPNHIYVIPPNTYMTVKAGVLILEPPLEPRGMRMPIDRFLCSLARDYQDHAIAIVLSGSGADGALGVREVKANGGMVMVQDPSTAQYDGMPRSAIATGRADAVLAPERMPEMLVRYTRQASSGHEIQSPADLDAERDPVVAILSLLFAKTGHDFRHYKKGTLVRRIHRRMGIVGVERAEDYLNLLREREGEVDALAKDLFIRVTSFFRDPEAWTTIADLVVAPVVSAHTGDEPIRVWVPGCATGEEAYSLAILFTEAFERANKAVKLLIFATDVDATVLQVGRAGLYQEHIAQEIAPERLSRFFSKESNGFRVTSALRDLVVFTAHNLIADPPFSRLDCISCRNILIYLEPYLQEKILRLFRFALKPGGFLVLGSSESLGSQQREFRTESKQWRIFQVEGPSRLGASEWPISAESMRQGAPPRSRRFEPRKASLAEMSKQALLDAFAPASVLVTRRYQVLYVYGDTSAYLAHPTGELTDDLLAMTRSELRLKTRAALHQAVGENRQVSLRGAQVRRGETVLPVAITVTPLQRPPDVAGLLLVSFRHEADVIRQAPEQEPGRGTEAEMERQLQEELKTTQDELQSTIEELETTNEELKASNEEAMSVNEELQSANEELETSKEELQSLNEELTTVNSQLQSKLAEVEDVNNDLANLLSSTNIATLFLDRELRIKRFTPATNRLMSLIPADIGRPVADIAPKFVDGDLQSDCRQVMETLYPVEREVQGQDGEWYIRRVQPYHSADQFNRRGRMAGTVVTFSNVTALKRREEEHARLASIVASSRDAITGETLDGIVTTWNPGAEALYGYRADEMLGHSSERLFHERLRSEFAHILAELRAGHPVGPYETERRRKDGTTVQVSVTHSPIHDHAGQVIAASTIARDITERVQAEAALRERVALQDQFSKVVATVPGVICSFRRRPDGSTAMPYASPMIKDLFGVEAQDVAADFGPIRDRIHPDDVSHVRDTIDQSARTMEPWRDAYRYRHPTKGEIWIEGHSVPTRELDGALLWHGYVHDITERKRTEKEIERLNQDLRQRLAELEAILDVSPIGIFLARDPGCKEMTANAAGSAMLGLPAGMNPSVTGPDAGRLPFRVFQQGKELAPDELPMQYAAAHNTGVTDFEALFVRSDGTKLNLLIYALPLHHDDGQVRGVLGMLVDITERKQMEQALRDRQADLERQAALLAEADRRKDEFLAVLGHELRNPLTPIRNAAHILARPEASPDQVSWAVDMICRQSEQLEQLVNDLLDVARITRGRIELRKSPLPVQDALADAIQSAAPTMEQRAQALEVQMPEVPLMVMADPMRLGQVFLNLLANAVKYTPNGGHIWIGLTQEGQTAVVRVRDDGIGILPEDRPHLFDFFSRGKAGHPDIREPDGLGVGLALARQLTERHGGTLEAHSVGLGHGSEFVVTLPLVAQTASAPASAAPHLTPGTLIPAHRILVVDDNRDVADSMAVLLTTMGHQVLALTAGRDAVAAIGDFRPDLVFLDIGMPDMNGFEAAAAIRALGLEPRPVLVALSGYRQDDKQDAVQKAGFDRHLLKPVRPDQIDALLADLG